MLGGSPTDGSDQKSSPVSTTAPHAPRLIPGLPGSQRIAATPSVGALRPVPVEVIDPPFSRLLTDVHGAAHEPADPAGQLGDLKYRRGLIFQYTLALDNDQRVVRRDRQIDVLR